MLDLRDLRKNPEAYMQALEKRGKHFSTLAQHFLVQLEKRHALLQDIEKLRGERNTLSKDIPKLEGGKRAVELKKLTTLGKKLTTEERKLKDLDAFEKDQEIVLPNVPLPDVPVGPDASGNVVLRERGNRNAVEQAKDYLTLGESLDIIDVKRAAKVSGSRFGYLKGAGALLELALVQFAMQELTKAGFTPVIPPVIINEPYMAAMGYLAQGGADEVYSLDRDKQFLVGTAEQAIGPYHAGETLSAAQLPLRYAGFSTCFRREAGSYGKDTKGILRVHQFDKVEMFVVCDPLQSETEHQKLLAMEEKLVSDLGLPYRVLQLCTGDLGFPSAKTYDIECWMPGQNEGRGEYRETHSTSNTTDYQSRALEMTLKREDRTKVIPHMLNGTAFAIGRTLIAILENYQQPDGSVRVPDALQPFMHGITIIRKA